MEYLGNGIWEDPENDRYVTQDGRIHFGLEDAEAHMDSNYWTQEELPMQKVIDDLKGLKVENFGVLPEYLTSPLDERGWRDQNFDLFDSSTWNVPTNIEDRTYVGAPGVNVPQTMRHLRPLSDEDMLKEIEQITDPIERQARLDEFDQQTLDQDIAFEQSGKSMIDVLAKDNPEIRTGFFPRKYYPEIATSNLSDYLEKGFRVKKTGISEGAAGHYNPKFDEIAVNPIDMSKRENYWDKSGSLPSWDRLLEIMGHEGIHMAYPSEYKYKEGTEEEKIYERRGLNALQHTLPWPENWSNPILAGNYPKAAGHEAMLNMDRMFFPGGLREYQYHNLNRKGVENLNAITSWTPYTPPRDRRDDYHDLMMAGQTSLGHTFDQSMKQFDRMYDYETGQRRGDYTRPTMTQQQMGREAQVTGGRVNPHEATRASYQEQGPSGGPRRSRFNTGGLVSLVL